VGVPAVSGLLILGAGGHGRVVADAALCAAGWQRVTASDRDPARCQGELIAGVRLLPLDVALVDAAAVHVAIGDAASRQREAAALTAGVLATVIHPRASVSNQARVSAGCFIAAQAVVAAGASVGVGVIVNHGAVVDHDVTVGDFSHIAPLVALGGAVRVGRRVLIGSSAAVLPGLTIADDVVVGAGAVVCQDLPEAGVYAGVPARKLK
jgi:sugar O-acyltransferase (sialic acid O-acetyltransferase NeuD family)